MKKYIITILAISIGILMSGSAMASTNISFSQSSVDVVAGETFTLTVSVNPNAVKNYTTSIKVKYPADLVEVTSFIQSSGWMSLTQSGYDSIDNVNGTIIKTAGYPKGFASTTEFGTITFKAKKSGTGSIDIQNGTLSYDASNVNVFAGTVSTSLKVGQATSSDVVKETSTSTKGQTATTTDLKKDVVNIVEDNEDVDTNIGQEATALGSLIASSTASTSENFDLTASVFGSGATKYLGYIGGIVVILGLIVWFIIFLINKKKKK
jgi:uncharacterized protein YcnI